MWAIRKLVFVLFDRKQLKKWTTSMNKEKKKIIKGLGDG